MEKDGKYVVHITLQGGEFDYLVSQQKVIVGRAPACDIVLIDDDISRRHVQIEFDADGCWVMDLGSANGTLLDDIPLPPRKKMPLTPHQVIQIPNFVLSVKPYRPGDPVETDKVVLQTGATTPITEPADIPLGKTVIGTFGTARPTPTPNFFLIFSGSEGSWQSVQLYDGEYIIGREPSCDIQIKSMSVSRQHAKVKVEGDQFWVTDLDSSNGVILEGEKIVPGEPHSVSPESVFVIAKMPFLVSKQKQTDTHTKARLSGFATQVVSAPVLDMYQSLSQVQPAMTQASMIAEVEFLDLSGQDRITIGRAADNDVQFDHPAVSRFHAMIERMGKRYRITDMQSANGVYLNGTLVEEQAWLKEGDYIKIGPFDFVFTGLGIQVDPAQGYTIEARGIKKWVTKELNLLKNISLDIGANEFVAVVGMSGAGKTTFMDTINGYRPATDGKVYVNGTDLYENYDMFRDDIGYVPQRDIVHMELTPWMALDYAGRLRFPPDTSTKERHEAVERTLKDLGLWERKDVVISRLSGGQLKRVSIGVELLTRPRLLFLDEPTSGLDPGTEFEMMRLMRGLADQGRTVMVVTHTTKNVMLCDKVVILGTGGYLVYYGAPEDALEYFDAYRTPREKLEKSMEFDEIYRLLEDPARGTPADWTERYQESDYAGKLADEKEETSEPSAGLSMAQLSAAAAPSIKQAKKISSLRQFFILSARNMRILFQDRVSLGLILALAPVLGLMNAIWGRNIYDPVDGNIEFVMGLWFMSAVVAMLVGAMSSVREIVKEADIYKRERAVGLKILPYIFSKIWMGLIMALYQGGVILLIALLLVVVPVPDKATYFEFFITIVLGVVTGYLVGLVISAMVPNQNAALIALIAVVVPQLLLGGLLIPLEEIPFGNEISHAVFSRWTLEGFVISQGMGDTLATDRCWQLSPEERSALTNEDKNDPACPCMGTNLFQDCPGIPGLLSPDFYDDVSKQALAQPEPAKPVEPTTVPTPTTLPTPTQLPSPTPLASPTPLPSPTPMPTPLLLYELEEYRDESMENNEIYFGERSDQMSTYYDQRSDQMTDYFDTVQDQFSDYSDQQKQSMEDYMDVRQGQAESYSSALDQYGNDLADWQRNRQKAVSAAENVLKSVLEKFGRAFKGGVEQRWLVLGIQSAIMFALILVFQKRKDIL
jgi:ABC-type multidrug transport system ATPase subunit/predicted component of type VI protein secretion system